MTNDEAKALLERDARILDVRNPEEFEQEHLENAINIPVAELDERLAELEPKNKPLIVHCAKGGRSARATGILTSAGFTEVHDISTMDGWPFDTQ